MIKTDNFEKIEITNASQLRAWLEDNHSIEESVWLVTFKKDAGADKYVSREAVLDELISFGWIDGIRRKLDDTRTMQLISRRKVQHWAKSYKDRAEKLIETGQMAAPGFRSIEAGKKTGLWTFMDDVDALITPDDLAQELSRHPNATAHFDAAADSYKRNLLRWIKLAKTDATRQKRILEVAKSASENRKIPQM